MFFGNWKSLKEFISFGKASAEVAQERFIRSDEASGKFVIYPSERPIIERLGISDETYLKYRNY